MEHSKFLLFFNKFKDLTYEAALEAKKARIFPQGSVLVAMIGQGKTRGAAALLEIDASINQNFACVIPRKIDSQYLFYALDFSYDRLRRSAHGSNQEALNCGLVENFRVPVTLPGEQVLVGTRLRECDELQAQLRVHVAKTQSLLTEITSAFFP